MPLRLRKPSTLGCQSIGDEYCALTAAIALADDIAKFPEMCMRADRRSAIAQWSLDVDEALIQEGAGGYEVATTEAITGAARFSGGAGRHGNFND